MCKESTTAKDTPKSESKRGHNRCRKLWCSGLALVMIWAVGGCSASQIQDTPAPGSETPPSSSYTRGTTHTSKDSTTSDPIQPKATPKHAEEQREIGTQGSTPEFDDSATVRVKDKEESPSGTKQRPEQPQPEEVIISTPAQTSDAQASSAPASIRHYTVRGGENLYTIASQPSIYADGMLWPLIYRANRDQIKNPRQIYPGQVLNIPRNISEMDKEQARAKAKESPIFPSDS